MKLYNTATKTRDEITPSQAGKINMYTCGPTVYHYAHIGNLRSYIMEDILEKYLSYTGYRVKRVMNITDVGHLASDADEGEDKMLKGAKREHKTVLEIAKYYTDAFFADCEKLNIKKPKLVIPATTCVDDFIKMISVLMEKNYAYEAGGNIYFDTSKLQDYYVFHDFNEEDLAVGVREGVVADDNKRNRADFVLWFTKSKFDSQELKWDSPWGIGYPGWHIECSAISLKYLGEHLDIHCGGIDNVFPHHTNEIAQSEAYLGHKWCNHWFHVLHLNTQGGKMSKSSGEFLTVSLLESKGYNPMVYRFFCLQSHYRKSLVFSYESLDNAKSAFDKLIARIAVLDLDTKQKADKEAFDKYTAQFKEVMDNDLNTSLAVTALYDILKSNETDATKIAVIENYDTVLSLDLIKIAKEQQKVETPLVAPELDKEIKELIEERIKAKKEKDYARADNIRQTLAARGITLIDTPSGTQYKIN